VDRGAVMEWLRVMTEERKEETKFCCQKNCRITVEDPLQQGAASPE